MLVKKVGENHDGKVLDWMAGRDRALDPNFVMQTQGMSIMPPCYILQGDNCDTTVRVRDMRSENQNKSLHYFNTYAAKDRQHFYKMDSTSNSKSSDLRSAPLSTFLPTMEDCKAIRDNYIFPVAKVLVEHLKFLHPLKKCVPCHVTHKYSLEMSRKSEIVSSHNMCR